METFLLLFMCRLAGVQEIISDQVDWCALTCGKGEQNTMCKYKPQKNAGYCKNIEKATTKTMRKDLLHLHNEFRDKITNGEKASNGVTWPKASNMRQMSWDYDLEKLAYRWVQQCIENTPHDKCRRTPTFKNNGQNTGWSSASDTAPPADESFYGWVEEISQTTPDIVDKLPNVMDMLHFTQVIWSETYKVGCAAIHADKEGMKATMLACNYGPGGNVIGGRIYQRGKPCTSCPPHTSCRPASDYPHLCAMQTDVGEPVDIDDPLENLPVDKVPTEHPTLNKSLTAESPPILNRSYKLKLFGMRPEDSKTPILLLSTILTVLTIKMFK